MKVLKTVLSVIGIAFFLLMALGCLIAPAYLSAALFLILALWISPLSRSLKESFANTTGKKIISVVVCAILFFVAIGVYPSTGSSQNVQEETIQNEVADAEETIEERSMPEEQNLEESSIEDITTSSDNESADTSNTQNDSNIVVGDSSDDNNSTDSTLCTTQNSNNVVTENHDASSLTNTQSNTNTQTDTNAQTSTDDSANQSVAATTTQATETPVTQPSESASTQSADNSSTQSSSGGNGGNANNFNLYNNPEQQQTTETWVLNTSSMKIHHPGCSSVASIKPENYAVSSQTLQELMSMGYTTCGRCFK